MALRIFISILLISLKVSSSEFKVIKKKGYSFVANSKSKVLSKRELLLAYKSNKEELEKTLGVKDIARCLRSIQSEYISKSQIIFCKSLSRSINPENYVFNLKGSCELTEDKQEEPGAPLKNQKLSKEYSLYLKYHCDCNPDQLSCKNKVYYCGRLYDDKLIDKSYDELLKLGKYNEIIGKSQTLKDDYLRKNMCSLNKIADSLPSGSQLFDHGLKLSRIQTRRAPSYSNFDRENILSLPKSCKYDEKKIRKIAENLKGEVYKSIKYSINTPKHEIERATARAVNGLGVFDCSNNWVEDVSEAIRNRDIPSVDLRRINPRDIKFPIDARVGNIKSKAPRRYKSKSSLEPYSPHNSCAEEIYDKLKKNTSRFIPAWKEYLNESKEKLSKNKEKLKQSIAETNKLKKEVLSDSNLKKYLQCKKYQKDNKDSWKKDTRFQDEHAVINELKQICGGYPELYEITQNKLDEEYRELDKNFSTYQKSKNEYFNKLGKSKNILDLDLEKQVSGEDINENITSLDNSEVLREIEVLKKDLKSKFKGDHNAYLRAINSIEKDLFEKTTSFEKNKVNNVSTELENIFPSLKIDRVEGTDVSKLIHISIGDDPVGGFIDSTLGEAVRGVGRLTQAALDLVRNTVREATTFADYHGKKFFRWVDNTPGHDLKMLIIKPINWIFCGGKQPPENPVPGEDTCYQGGIKCDQNSEGTTCRLTDSQGNPSEVGGSNDEQITEEQLQWMRDMELQDTLASIDFAKEMSSWMSDSSDAKFLQGMLAKKQKELNAKLENGIPADPAEQAKLAAEIKRQKDIVDLIKAGVSAAGDNVIQTFKDLINIAQTAEELKATINFVAENGIDGLADSIGESLEAYWGEYQDADATGKAEIIGRVTSDIALSLIPVGAVAKIGKGAIQTASKASKLASLSEKIAHTTNSISQKFKLTGNNYLGNAVEILSSQAGSIGNLSQSIGSVSSGVVDWVGSGARLLHNKSGDIVILSGDGSRKFRVDLKNSHGDRPHVHLEKKVNGKWKDVTSQHRIYPNGE